MTSRPASSLFLVVLLTLTVFVSVSPIMTPMVFAATTLSLSQNIGPTGTTVTVSGSGWHASETLTLTSSRVGHPLWSGTYPKTCSVNYAGIIGSCSFTVSNIAIGGVPAIGGVHTITAAGSSGDSQTVDFTVQSTFVLTPNSGPVGSTGTMSGTGYLQSLSSATCAPTILSTSPNPTFDPATVTCAIDGNGVLTGSFTINTGAVLGPHTVTVSGATYVQQVSISVTFTVTTLTIILTPNFGPTGQLVTVTGSGWGSDTSVTLTVSATLWDLPATRTCPVSGGNIGSCSFTVSNLAPGGTRTITVTGAPSGVHTDVQFFVRSTFFLNPTSGPVDSTGTMSGSGYLASLSSATCAPTILVTSPNPTFSSATCQIDGYGVLTGSFTVDHNAAYGAHTVTVSSSTYVAQGTITGTTFTVISTLIILTPSSGPTGQLVTVTGSGWGSDTSVTLTVSATLWDLPATRTCPVSGGNIGSCSFTVKSNALGSDRIITVTGTPSGVHTDVHFFVLSTLILTPNGGGRGTTGTISGSGYLASLLPAVCPATILSTNPNPTFNPATVSCQIDANGVLTGSFTIDPGAIFGAHTVTVSDVAHVAQISITVPFTVSNPTISLSVSAAPTGTTVTVTGSGWSSSDTSVTLTPDKPLWSGPDPVCSVSGGNIGSCSFTVASTATGGLRNIKATSAVSPLETATTTFTVQSTFVLTPNSGTRGSTGTMSGSGYVLPLLPAVCAPTILVTSPNPTFNPATVSCQIDANGVLTGSFTVASGAAYGAHTVTVSSSTYVAQGSLSATFTVTGPAAMLTPSFGAQGVSVTVSGTGFDLTDGATCVISEPTGNLFTSYACGLSSGVVTGSFTVAATAAPGTYTVTVKGSNGDSAEASFVVSPGVSLSASSGGPGTSVLVTGKGFASSDTGCSISSDRSGLILSPVCTLAGGSLAGSFKVADGASGVYNVTVTGTSGDKGWVLFYAPGASSLTLGTTSGPVGTVVSASGSGFSGTTCAMTAVPSSLFTSASCSISAGSLTGGFTVAPGAALGSYTVIVTTDAGPTDSASASFTVTSGPASTFSLNPTSGLGGAAVTVSGSNYAGTTCSLSSTPSGLFASTPTCSISGGTLTGSFTVAAGVSAGGYTVKVTTNAASDTNIAQFTIPAPTFALTPTSSPVGTTIAASGVNYAGTTCTLSSSPSGLFTSQTCSISSGALSGGFTVASTAYLGGYIVTVTTNVAGETKTASFAVESPGPQTFALSPSSGPAGISVSASGENYAGTTCSLSSTPLGLFTSSSCAISAGTLSGSFTVTAGASDGYTVSVTTNLSEVKSASFTSTTSPSPTLNPTSGSPGTSIQVSGLGYHGTTCTLTSSPSGLFSSSSCFLSSGMLTGSFTIASGASGSYTVTLTTDAGETVQSSFTVRSSISFTLTPISGSSGTAVSASGNNYQGTSCSLSSSPQGLMSSSICAISGGKLTGGFNVATGAAVGGYTVTVTSDVSSDTTSAVFSVTKATTAMCIIATATFGSEASPAVQFLRNFRDGLVVHTSAGSAFMTVFNAWYYSFSPTVASFISTHDPIRAPIKVILYPLLGILSVSTMMYSIFSWTPEFGVLMAGLVASSLIGLVYLTPFMLVGMRSLTRRKRINTISMAKASLAVLAVGLGLLAAGELAGSFLILAVASSAIVLTCIIAAPTIVALLVLRPKSQ